MPSLLALIAPLAFVLPLGMLGESVTDRAPVEPVAEQSRNGERKLGPLPLSGDAPAWSPILEGIEPPASQQVRIERRVILRISPAPGPARQNLTAAVPRNQPKARLVERKMGKCVESGDIAGVADRGDYLMMIMRDRRTVAARLEKGCSPRDFYQGFYLERSDDGKLCIDRDRIMSRSGAKCQVDRFSELVVERED